MSAEKTNKGAEAKKSPKKSRSRANSKAAKDQAEVGAGVKSGTKSEAKSETTSGDKAADKSSVGSSEHKDKSAHKSSAKEAGASLFDQIKDYTNKMTAGALDVAKVSSAMPLKFTDGWLKDLYTKTIDHERLRAMAEAGDILKDARQVAGLNLQELAEAIGLKDAELLEQVEKGKATLPFEITLRIASLIARHDPIPLILKFVRTYNPEWEEKLEHWGVSALPRQYERERRFGNIFRKYDQLREMSDEEFARLIEYQESSMAFVLEIMQREKEKNR